MTDSRFHVYIGIVTYNSALLMRKCIDAALKQRYAPITIVVLDNNSHDKIDRVLARYGDKIRFIKSTKNLGFGGGHNKIIQSVHIGKRDYYMALNPDAILDLDCISKLVEGAGRHNADWATGKLYRDYNIRVLYSVGHAIHRDGYAFNIGYGHQDTGQYSDEREVFGAAGAAALYKGSMIQAVSVSGNFFDPALFMYYEDVDVDWRARLLGLHCWFMPEARIYHKGGVFPEHLEGEVLVNRFLSIIKNAFFLDLFTYNLPVMTIHVAVRLVVTPFIGAQIVLGVLRGLPQVLLYRSHSRATRSEMLRWFMSAKREISYVPLSVWQRVCSFVNRKLNKYV